MQLTPPPMFSTVFSCGAVRMDTPSFNHLHAYDSDKRFFATNRGRTMYIRRIIWAEFGETLSECPSAYHVSVWVQQHRPGFHTAMAIFVSASEYVGHESTDDETYSVVCEMHRRCGADSDVRNQAKRAYAEFIKAVHSLTCGATH